MFVRAKFLLLLFIMIETTLQIKVLRMGKVPRPPTPCTNPSTSTAGKPSKLPMEVMEATLTSPTREKFKDERYDMEDDELYTV